MLTTIETTRFGQLEYAQEDILSFPAGLPGFESQREWVLAGDEDNPIKWLQSIQDGELALPVAVASVFFPEYRVTLTRADMISLRASDQEELVLLVVLIIPAEKPWNATANLRAPLLVNTKVRIARQIIFANDDLPFQAPLLTPEVVEELQKQSLQTKDLPLEESQA